MANKTNQNKEVKKTSKASYFIVASLLIIVGVVVVVALMNSNGSMTGNVINSNNEQNCKDVQIPYDYLEEYQETIPYTDRECETKNLAYSIDNFVIDSNTCNKYEDECHKWFLGLCTDKTTYCVDKSISCSLLLRNLDNEERGGWTMRFSFFEAGTNNVIKNEDVNSLLYPQSQDTVRGITRIQSTGVDGDANKQLTCSYQAANIPTKQICRDVTKYKEITKTRTVTRYRTENKCE